MCKALHLMQLCQSSVDTAQGDGVVAVAAEAVHVCVLETASQANAAPSG